MTNLTLKLKHIEQLSSSCLMFVCMFSITRCVPFKSLSILVTTSLFALFAVSFRAIFINICKSSEYLRAIYLINIFLLFIMLSYSGLMENDMGLAVRFFMIFAIILTAYFHPPHRHFINIFLFLACLHSLVLVIFEIYMAFFTDYSLYQVIRMYFNENGYGDVFTFNGFFYRVQIVGNSVIPVSLFIAVIYLKNSWRKYIAAILLLSGTVIAGNFAFLIATLFFAYLYLSLSVKLTYQNIVVGTVLMVLLVLGGYLLTKDYSTMVLERKKDVSLGARADQTALLMDDLAENSFSLLFGKGLGHTIAKETQFRDYTGTFYYELQTLYLLNQTGIIYFSLFVLTNVILILKFINNKKLLLIYASYLVYAVTNPYIFDSVHVLLIIVLVSMRKEIASDEPSCAVRHKLGDAFDQVPSVFPS